MVTELKQIKDDGFNTIVLTVPWRGFEIGFDQVQTTSNPALYQRLDKVLSHITELGLLFVLRVGFPHDYTPDTGTDGMAQCVGLYTDATMQNHWLDYLNKINQAIKPHQANAAGILVSWEDFWCPHFVFPHLDETERLELSQKMAYGEWLKQQNTNLVKVLLQENDLKYDNIKIPRPAELSYVLYLEFIDYKLDKEVLKPAQSVFDHAAMEIRVDKLPIKQGEHYTWVGHDLYLDETNHRGTYWAPFWGAANQGELLTASQALKNFEFFLNYVTADGQNIDHVIEQFNFTDNTPYFPNNANIIPEQIDDFLLAAAPLLKQRTRGAGVWSYRDYTDNALYNSSFEMGLDGWQVNGEVDLLGNDDDQHVVMHSHSQIKQSFISVDRFMLIGAYDTVQLCLNAAQGGAIKVLLDEVNLGQFNLPEGRSCVDLEASGFNSQTPVTFAVLAVEKTSLDELQLSGFTQRLGLYDAQGQPGPYLEAYRTLNQMLSE